MFIRGSPSPCSSLFRIPLALTIPSLVIRADRKTIPTKSAALREILRIRAGYSLSSGGYMRHYYPSWCAYRDFTETLVPRTVYISKVNAFIVWNTCALTHIPIFVIAIEQSFCNFQRASFILPTSTSFQINFKNEKYPHWKNQSTSKCNEGLCRQFLMPVGRTVSAARQNFEIFLFKYLLFILCIQILTTIFIKLILHPAKRPCSLLWWTINFFTALNVGNKRITVWKFSRHEYDNARF